MSKVAIKSNRMDKKPPYLDVLINKYTFSVHHPWCILFGLNIQEKKLHGWVQQMSEICFIDKANIEQDFSLGEKSNSIKVTHSLNERI